MFFDPVYLLFMVPALVLSLVASAMTKSAFNRYSRQRTATGLTGAEAARLMLDRAGVRGVQVVPTSGFLSDHYNPVTRTLALSEEVYHRPSVAAVGVACHEAGHAIQHATSYAPLWLRSALVPVAGIGSNLGYLIMFLGLIVMTMMNPALGVNMVLFGAVLFSAVLLFQIITLPVEFNASARAKQLAFRYGLVADHERRGISKVLNAAALTYVAAAVSTLMTLLYFLLRAGLLGGSDD